MSLPPPRRLASFVQSPPDERQIDRAWAAIEPRAIPRASRPAWLVAVGGGALAAAAFALIFLLRSRGAAPALAGVVVESGSEQTVTLEDGTRATLRSGARLRYDRVQADQVELTLERGEVDFDVRHRESRVFRVHARGVEVVDRGTRFSVDVEDDRVRVSVESGLVEVTRATGAASTLSLKAGDSWTNGGAVVPAAPEVPSSSPLPSGPDPTPSQPTSSAPVAAAGTSARELFQSAKAARLAGHPRDAAAAFDLLRRRFRDDPRAGLAAFELGRLRLDSLGDPAGAAEALADSVALAPGATFREDAEARLVEAFDRMHDGRCSAARRSYLARYPAGVHTASVSARCP